MALTSLDAAADIVAVNRRNLQLYGDGLQDLTGISLLAPDDRGENNAQHVVLRVGLDASPISRDRLNDVLNAENVLARRYFYPGCHRMAPYSQRAVVPQLPVTESLAEEVLVLPTGTAIGPGDIAAICELIGFAHREAAEITVRTPIRASRT